MLRRPTKQSQIREGDAMKVPFGWLREYVDVGKTRLEEAAGRLTIAGLEVVLIERIAGDAVFDIEVTPNRPDCLSILGVAREASASLKKRLKAPGLKPPKEEIKDSPYIELKDKKLCPRYTGRIIRDVKVAPSPKWLADRLKPLGLRPVNNIVDITNYCLFELGQPTHAFDYDKIKGKVVIRRSHKGERIITIDDKRRTLEEGMLIIADEEKPIAIGGVMGSKNTEVTDKTKNILFESAYFNPVSIRKTSRRLGLISESSYRFERSVDMGMVAAASNRACSLILELCGGKAGPLRDKGKKPPAPVNIYLRPDKLKALLGLEISSPAIKKILSSLQLKVGLAGKKTIAVSVPSFRQDLKNEVDIIEEVVRIYGYDRLPSTMPTIVGHPRRMDLSREIINTTRDNLISIGLDEVITYSLMSREDLKRLDGTEVEEAIVIKNPLSIEQEIMRPTMVPAMLNAISWNLNRGAKDLKIFELGKVYHSAAGQFKEEDCICAVFSGNKPYDWHEGHRDEPLFFSIKGVIEELLERLGVRGVLFKSADFPSFIKPEGASIWIGKEKIGFLGKLDKNTAQRFDIAADLFLCEISLEKLFTHVRLDRRFRQIPKFPSSTRDVSMIVKKEVSHQDILSTIKAAGGELAVNVELFDQYFGAQIQEGARGLSYSIEYRAKDRTLTDEEVTRLHAQICDALVQKLGAIIR
jgi:phenylalanyl-tRNA synthetase beta chain